MKTPAQPSTHLPTAREIPEALKLKLAGGG